MKMKWTDKYYNIDFKSSSVSEAYNKNGLLVRAHTPDLLHMLTVPPPLKHVHALVIENYFCKTQIIVNNNKLKLD